MKDKKDNLSFTLYSGAKKRKRLIDCVYAVHGPDNLVYCWALFEDGLMDMDTLCPFVQPDAAAYECPYGKPVKSKMKGKPKVSPSKTPSFRDS